MKRIESPKQPVAVRVAAAIEHLRAEDPGKRLTVSGVCRMAGTSRANLYESHREVIKAIRSQRVPKSKTKVSLFKNDPRLVEENARLRKQVAALTLLCVEQRVALDAVRSGKSFPEKRGRS